MFYLKKSVWQCFLLAFPFVLAIIAAFRASPIISIIAMALVFLDVVILPVCKNNECAYMFFLTAVTVTPINIRLIIHFLGDCESALEILISVLVGLLAYFMMLSIEEIIMGIVTRFLFPKQESFDCFEYTNSQ